MAEFKFLPLAKIKANQQNPRIISESKLKKLINSLLVFPKMMELRPITIDENNFVLGGNMRQLALGRISNMTFEQLHNYPYRRAAGFNTNSCEKRSHFEGMTMAEYMHWLWNNPQSGQNLYKMFEGVVTPDGKDENGDLIYVYKPERTI